MRGSTVAKWFARLSLGSLCCCPRVDVPWLPIGKKEIYGRNTRNTCCFSAQSSVKGPRSHGVWTHTSAIYRAHTHTHTTNPHYTPMCGRSSQKRKKKKSPSIFALTENPNKNIIIFFLNESVIKSLDDFCAHFWTIPCTRVGIELLHFTFKWVLMSFWPLFFFKFE